MRRRRDLQPVAPRADDHGMPVASARLVAGAALTLVLASCGSASGGDVLVERRTVIDDASSVVSTTTSTTATALESPLSIDDALMDDGDIAPPWELQHRDGERPGYSVGPNQTDCEPYWRYERRHGLTGGHALWWRDGGNVNHEVFRAESSAAATEFLQAMRELPEVCPVTSWSEGDSFRIEAVDLGHDGIVGLQFVDGIPEESHHVAISARGDLISVVWVVQWPPLAGGELPPATTDDLARWAARARERLAGAGDAPPTTTTPDPTTTTTTPNGPVTTVSGGGQPVPGTAPTNSTLPPPPASTTTTSVPDPTGLAGRLLTDRDLVNLPGWSVGTPRRFDEDETDSSMFEGCPGRESIDELGRIFSFRANLDHDEYERSEQYIGETVDAQAASDLVAAFATLADCELAWAPFPVALDGGPLDVPGSSAAARLGMTVDDPEMAGDGFQLIVIAVENRVTALGFPATLSTGPDPAEILLIAELAAFALAR